MPGPLPTQRPGLRLIEPQGGGTSSRPDDKNVVAGVDTLRLRWREDREVYERWRRRPQGCYEGARGELWDRLPGTGARVGVLPDGLVYVEGRVAALLHGEDDHSLVPAGRLPLAARVTAERLAELGVRVEAEPAVGRADLAAELRFEDGRDGHAFLIALGAVNVPWHETSIHAKGQRVQSVAVTSGRAIQHRAYDKGLESGTDEPGRRVRLERQLRLKKRDEQTVEQFATSDLRARFLGRLAVFESAPPVAIVDAGGAIDRLAELAQAGVCSWSQRNRLTGVLVHGLYAMPLRARQRAESELRDLGIAVQPGRSAQRLVIPIAPRLRELADAWAA